MTLKPSESVTAAIIGASGYTGIELTRLLLNHPFINLKTITSRQFAGQKLAHVFAEFSGQTELSFKPSNIKKIGQEHQVVFLCLPHHESMETAASLREMGVKVIDLSADFRFKHVKAYEKTYGPHTQKKLLKKAQYGLCEIFAANIKKSYLIGVPGCYVTSILLGLAPVLQNQLVVTDQIYCDSKSGTTGAGRKAEVSLLHAEVHNNFKAYAIGGHRHRPEIEENLSLLAGKDIKVSFQPHLLPIARGILSTIYIKPIRKWKDAQITQVFQRFYKSSPFVQVLENGLTPQIKDVVGTNNCQISVHYDAHSENLVILSALDNLLKGASGQAVQCLNLMCGFDETTGLIGSR